MRTQKPFNAEKPSTLSKLEYPKLPQALDLVNQTALILSEPKKENFLKKNIISFKESTEDDIQSFYHALAMDESLREKRNKEAERLLVKTREMPVN